MIPDKVYLQDGVSVPVVGFVSPAWDNPRYIENPVEFVRKDLLLEWLEKRNKELLGEPKALWRSREIKELYNKISSL